MSRALSLFSRVAFAASLLSAAAGCSDISGGEIDPLTEPPLEATTDVDTINMVDGTTIGVRLYAIAGGGRVDPTEVDWTASGSITLVSVPGPDATSDTNPDSYFYILAFAPGDYEIVGESSFRGGEAHIKVHVDPQP